MRSYFAWMILFPVAIGSLWQLWTPEPFISSVVAGLLLLFVGGLAGLRIGTDSALQFVRDLARLNEYLAEQNSDLAQCNHRLLIQVLAEANEMRELAEDDSGGSAN